METFATKKNGDVSYRADPRIGPLASTLTPSTTLNGRLGSSASSPRILTPALLASSTLAATLYAHVVDYAREHDYDYIYLNVWEGNENAQRFYERVGMTPRKTFMEMKLC